MHVLVVHTVLHFTTNDNMPVHYTVCVDDVRVHCSHALVCTKSFNYGIYNWNALSLYKDSNKLLKTTPQISRNAYTQVLSAINNAAAHRDKYGSKFRNRCYNNWTT